MDLSHLDKKYFLDGDRYNCPFCNRGSVSYRIIGRSPFYWSDEKFAYLYLVKCQETECAKVSLHLSYYDFRDEHGNNKDFDVAPRNLEDGHEFDLSELDSYFFFHQPTSFFTIDSRINRPLRELLSEAENCLKMNFLVGASACIRKTIYELIDLEEARVLQKNGRTNYQESIKSLKKKFPKVPEEYFVALANIQELTSDKIHEGSWEAWDSQKIKVLIELTKNVLCEMYVVPQEQKGRVGVVDKLISAFKATKTPKENND